LYQLDVVIEKVVPTQHDAIRVVESLLEARQRSASSGTDGRKESLVSSSSTAEG